MPNPSSSNCFTTRDNLKLHYRLDLPKTIPIKHYCIFLHGLSEHIGRFDEIVSFMNSQGVAMAGFDYRGHGKSEGERGNIRSFQDFLGDVSDFKGFIDSRLGDEKPEKYILFGNSMGGLIATKWVINNSSAVKALLLTAPCFGIPAQKVSEYLAKFLLFLCPRGKLKKLIPYTNLSSQREEVEKYRLDELVLKEIGLKLITEMLATCHSIRNERPINHNIQKLILTADHERVVNNKAIRLVYNQKLAKNSKIINIPGSMHEIFHDVKRNVAFQAISDWLSGLR